LDNGGQGINRLSFFLGAGDAGAIADAFKQAGQLRDVRLRQAHTAQPLLKLAGRHGLGPLDTALLAEDVVHLKVAAHDRVLDIRTRL
jgi:hypothetical protein